MFKLLAQEFVTQYSFLNLFNFITFRVGASILTSLFFSLIFGQLIINKLTLAQPEGQPIREDGPENHIIQKAGHHLWRYFGIELHEHGFQKSNTMGPIEPARRDQGPIGFIQGLD